MPTKKRALIEIQLAYDCGHDGRIDDLQDAVNYVKSQLKDYFYYRRDRLKGDLIQHLNIEIVAFKYEDIKPTGEAAPSVLDRQEELAERQRRILEESSIPEPYFEEDEVNYATYIPPPVPFHYFGDPPNTHRDAAGRLRNSNGTFASNPVSLAGTTLQEAITLRPSTTTTWTTLNMMPIPEIPLPTAVSGFEEEETLIDFADVIVEEAEEV